MSVGIFDYLIWRGDVPIEQAPFNEVDGAILARLSYLPFEHIVSGRSTEPVRLAYAAEELITLPEFEKRVLQKEDAELVRRLSESARFREMQIIDFAAKTDAETQTQFFAASVRINDGCVCVCFRGTDNTLIGWREDFNMGFVCPVPAQSLAAQYLERIAAANTRDKIIVTGHSKGGNLAVYASAFCKASARKRIETVYNYDGPGFDGKVLLCDGYNDMRSRIKTFVPQFSVVGMLLGHEETYTIVKSERISIMQHDIYSWQAERDRFVHLDTISNGSKFIDYTLKEWLADMDYKQREKFVEALFAVINETNVSTLKEFNDNFSDNARSVLKSVKNLDDTTGKAVIKAVVLLAKSAGSGFDKVRRDKKN